MVPQHKHVRFVAGVLVSKWCPSTKIYDLLPVSWSRSGGPALRCTICLGVEVVPLTKMYVSLLVSSKWCPSTKMYVLLPVSSKWCPSTKMYDLLMVSWSRSGGPALRCTLCCRCLRSGAPALRCTICCRCLGLEVVPQY